MLFPVEVGRERILNAENSRVLMRRLTLQAVTKRLPSNLLPSDRGERWLQAVQGPNDHSSSKVRRRNSNRWPG
jgi:hypothetical protein